MSLSGPPTTSALMYQLFLLQNLLLLFDCVSLGGWNEHAVLGKCIGVKCSLHLVIQCFALLLTAFVCTALSIPCLSVDPYFWHHSGHTQPADKLCEICSLMEQQIEGYKKKGGFPSDLLFSDF